MLATRAVPALVCAVGLCASVDVAMAVGVVPPGSFKCPCQAGPYPGMTKIKYSTMYPNGDKFKMVCTNQAATGNFQSKYCKAGGGQVCIGECIYVGGQNQMCFTYDAQGNPCTITHKNTDDATPDNPNHQRKVYVYDVKAGTVTTTCYKRNPDGTYTPVGRPMCRRVVFAAQEPYDAGNGQDAPLPIDEENPDAEFKAAAAAAAEVAPQTVDVMAVAEVNLPTGARDIRFFTPGEIGQVPLHIGDVFTFHGVGPETLTRIGGKFEVRSTPGGVQLVSLVEGYITNDETIARISAGFSGPLNVQATSVGASDMTRLLVASQCAAVAVEPEVFDTMSVDTYANIASPPSVPDANRDGVVDSRDIAIVLGGYGGPSGPSDTNLDGVVNQADLVEVLTAYGYRED